MQGVTKNCDIYQYQGLLCVVFHFSYLFLLWDDVRGDLRS